MPSGRPLKDHNIREGKGARRRRGRRRKESPSEVKASSRVFDSVDIADGVDNGDRGRRGEREASPPSYHDGLIEVVAVEGVLHLGQIQVRGCWRESRSQAGVAVGVDEVRVDAVLSRCRSILDVWNTLVVATVEVHT